MPNANVKMRLREQRQEFSHGAPMTDEMSDETISTDIVEPPDNRDRVANSISRLSSQIEQLTRTPSPRLAKEVASSASSAFSWIWADYLSGFQSRNNINLVVDLLDQYVKVLGSLDFTSGDRLQDFSTSVPKLSRRVQTMITTLTLLSKGQYMEASKAASPLYSVDKCPA